MQVVGASVGVAHVGTDLERTVARGRASHGRVARATQWTMSCTSGKSESVSGGCTEGKVGGGIEVRESSGTWWTASHAATSRAKPLEMSESSWVPRRSERQEKAALRICEILPVLDPSIRETIQIPDFCPVLESCGPSATQLKAG